MLAIGEFSRFTHLSVRTLRRYHESGLLVPAVVDEATGYRSYDPDQIATAQVIHRLRELPAVELASTVHVGSHDVIDVTYGELGSWVVANTLAVAGPVREVYHVGPRDTPDLAAWRTGIGWPVFRVQP